MTDHAIIAGSFADFKIIKTRSTAQLIIEIPIEHADEALERLGGVPQSGKERPVAVARLNLDVARELAPQASEKPKGGRLAQQAGIVCNEGAFRQFLIEQEDLSVSPGRAITTAVVAEAIRLLCGVDSRSELDSNPDAAARWRDIHGRYLAWREAA